MQEQPHYKISPEEGWSRMKPILDKEMPVNKSRWPILWWSVAAITGIAIASIFLLPGSVQLTDQPAANQSTKEIPAVPIQQPEIKEEAIPQAANDQSAPQLIKKLNQAIISSSKNMQVKESQKYQFPVSLIIRQRI